MDSSPQSVCLHSVVRKVEEMNAAKLEVDGQLCFTVDQENFGEINLKQLEEFDTVVMLIAGWPTFTCQTRGMAALSNLGRLCPRFPFGTWASEQTPRMDGRRTPPDISRAMDGLQVIRAHMLRCQRRVPTCYVIHASENRFCDAIDHVPTVNCEPSSKS